MRNASSSLDTKERTSLLSCREVLLSNGVVANRTVHIFIAHHEQDSFPSGELAGLNQTQGQIYAFWILCTMT